MFLAQPTPDFESLGSAIDTSGLRLWDYVTAVAILLCAVLIGRLIRFLLKRITARAGADEFLGDLIGRLIGYVIVSFGFVYSLDSLSIAVAPVLGALGIVGFALAFALQDILENFVAGILLQLRRPFKPGDEIVSVEHEGRVLRIDARTVTVLTPEGETVQLPSAEVIKHPIVNHTHHGRRRTTLEVGVSYETDLDVAAKIARTAAASVAGVLASPPPQALVHNFGESSIDLAIRYWHAPSISDHWAIRDHVARAVASAFRSHQIEIPLPQRVLHTTAVEQQ